MINSTFRKITFYLLLLASIQIIFCSKSGEDVKDRFKNIISRSKSSKRPSDNETASLDSLRIDSTMFLFSEPYEYFEDGEPKSFYVYEDGVIKMTLEYWEPGVKKKMIEYNGNTKPNGRAVEWDMNGNKIKEVHYREGLRYGPSYSWFPDGQKEIESNYNNDVLNGTKTKWYKNGNKEYEINFDYGTPHGKSVIWYENGQVEEETDYNQGKIDGKKINYYDNGEKRYECTYRKGVKNGPEIFWDEQGNKVWEIIYRSGEMISKENFDPNQ